MSGVLVLGAGELGLAVLEALVRHPKRNNTKIAVLLRQKTAGPDAPQKQKTLQHIRDLGIEIETADVVQASIDDLAAIFAQYDTVVSCNGMGLPSGTQVKLTRAVLQSRRVRRYVPWQFGMDYDVIGTGSAQDLFDEQLEVRRLLRGEENKNKLDWVIVSTGLFMSFLFLPAFGVVDLASRTVHALGRWDNRITITTPVDIGVITADVVLDPQDIHSQVVFAAGDTISYEALANLLDSFSPEPFHRELWDLDTLQKQFRDEQHNPAALVMVKYRLTFAQGRGVAWDKADTINQQRNISVIDVPAYVKQLVEEKQF